MSIDLARTILAARGVAPGDVEDRGGGVYVCPSIRDGALTICGVRISDRMRDDGEGGQVARGQSIEPLTASSTAPSPLQAARARPAGGMSAALIDALTARCAAVIAADARAWASTAAMATRLLLVVGADALGLLDLTLDGEGRLTVDEATLLATLEGRLGL